MSYAHRAFFYALWNIEDVLEAGYNVKELNCRAGRIRGMPGEELYDVLHDVEEEAERVPDDEQQTAESPSKDIIVQKKRLDRHHKEMPDKSKRHRVGLYIRYFNQTKYENYLELHKKRLLKAMDSCPNWTVVDFYVDYGSTAPHMENAPEWVRLLSDCEKGRVDLIITQKVSNVSRKEFEVAFCARLLACLNPPVGIYFIAQEIYTLASYYTEDLHNPWFSAGIEPIEKWALSHGGVPEQLESGGIVDD